MSHDAKAVQKVVFNILKLGKEHFKPGDFRVTRDGVITWSIPVEDPEELSRMYEGLIALDLGSAGYGIVDLQDDTEFFGATLAPKRA